MQENKATGRSEVGPGTGSTGELRPARPEDLAAIARVHQLSWTSMMNREAPDVPLEPFLRRGWEERWRGPLEAAPRDRQGVAVLERGEEIAGVAWLGPYRNRGLTRPERALLRRLFVLPELQGSGAGSRLLEWAEARAEAGGAWRLELWCLELNRGARQFYERRGYQRDGAEGLVRRDGLELVKLRYRKLLPSHPEFRGHRHGYRRRRREEPC